MRHRISNQRGMILGLALPILLVLAVLATATSQSVRSGMHRYAVHRAGERAFYVADSGLEAAKTRLYVDRQTAGANLGYTATSSGTVDGLGFTYAIAQDPSFPNDPTRKLVTSTGNADNRSATVVSQVAVYPVVNPPTSPTPGGSVATCDWAIFANTGTAEVVNAVGAVTSLMNAGVHSNNTLAIRNLAGVGVTGSGRFQSVGNATIQSTLSVLSNTGIELRSGGSIGYQGIHLHLLLVNTGIHFANGTGGHGQANASVPRLGFPYVDWSGLEQAPGVVVVDANNVPFGTWESGTNTWVTAGLHLLPSEITGSYVVHGNVRFRDLALARETNVTIAALGSIQIDQLSLVQSAVGAILPVVPDLTQTLRLLAKGDVYVGRGLLQTADAARGDVTRPGLNLTSGALALRNRIAAYSETGDVWIKSSAISAASMTALNLVGYGDASYVTTASALSAPVPFCQTTT